MHSKVLELYQKIDKLEAQKEDLLSILTILASMHTINADLHLHIQKKLDLYKESP